MGLIGSRRRRGQVGGHAVRGMLARSGRGQAMVEFVVVLTPLILIVVAIIQFGLLYGAHVTLTNAAREGARAGTIYVYNHTETTFRNDAHRCAAILEAATASFGLLDDASPHFSATTSGGICPIPSSTTLVNGDITISYCASAATDDPCPDPSDSLTDCVTDTRQGCFVRVEISYHSDVVVPLISALLSTDGNGRFLQRATATMVVN
ncbi:MAG TPA: TadE family protein [Candidatus Limnocylindria bacterium]|nr:TadE family protein [Candidatus Limnocylindria bacterium]